jgi:hypothetical protein
MKYSAIQCNEEDYRSGDDEGEGGEGDVSTNFQQFEIEIGRFLKH